METRCYRVTVLTRSKCVSFTRIHNSLSFGFAA